MAKPRLRRYAPFDGSPAVVASFIGSATEAFGFLAAQHGFRGPLVRPGQTQTVRFLGNTVGVECEFDTREVGAYVLLVLLKDGELPDGYYVDASRKVVRKHLGTWLKEHGVGVDALRVPEWPDDLPGQLHADVHHDARLLREHGQRILSDDVHSLD